MRAASLSLFALLLVLSTSPTVTAFLARAPETISSHTPSLPAPFLNRHAPTVLRAKLWDRLEIEEDPEPFWYLLNCVAGLELDLLRQCREKCADMPDAIKFVVPVVRKTRSHGANRMVTDVKPKYQGYVFAKLRLCPEVYEAIQELDLCRSWMGTVNWKGYKKLPPAPVALNELEVENFGLEDEDWVEEEEEEEEDGVIVDSEENDEQEKDEIDPKELKVYRGLKVEDMVKVTEGKSKFFKEDGIVRRLKEGKILVRFFTYGTMYEEWLDPGDVRKLSGEEILRGLSGPSQPITQRDFDGPPSRRDNWSERRGGGLRQSLMSNIKGARGPRNTRRDRTSRGDSYRRDMFGRTAEERRREERNWKWYQEKQRNQGNRAPVSGQVDDEWNFRGGSRPNRDDMDDSALRDVDSQWGRQSQRQRRRERRSEPTQETKRVESAVEGKDDWSAFVSPVSSPVESDEDAFFESLMSDLTDDLSSSQPEDKGPDEKRKPKKSAQDEDEFFASLMSELSDDKGSTKETGTKSGNKQPAGGDDDFFAALEAELGSAFEEKENSGSDDSDDFFAKLEAEMNLSSGSSPGSPVEAASPELDEPAVAKTDDVIPSGGTTSKKSASKDTSASTSTGTSDDLSKRTVVQLKEMLRERGLKVSGRKSELIDRLMQAN